MQRAHLQHAHAFALSLDQHHHHHQNHNQSSSSHHNSSNNNHNQQQQRHMQQTAHQASNADYDDSENSDNDAATADDATATKPINAPLDQTTAAAANYLSNLDKLLKNQFLHQINFHAAINDCNRAVNQHTHTHTDLMTRDNDSKMNSKSTNFTIENLIRK